MIIEDQGIIIALKSFEERYLLVKCFLKEHGLMNGLLSNSKKNQRDFLNSNIVEVSWSARLRDQLGYFKFELTKNVIALAAFDRVAIMIINSALAMLSLVLHEKEKQLNLFRSLHNLLNNIGIATQSAVLRLYLDFELELLKAGGFGLALDRCIATNQYTDLYYISPKSGAAVSRSAGLPYHDKLLILTDEILCNEIEMTIEGFIKSLQITEFFIEKNLLAHIDKKMPLEREMMIGSLRAIWQQ